MFEKPERIVRNRRTLKLGSLSAILAVGMLMAASSPVAFGDPCCSNFACFDTSTSICCNLAGVGGLPAQTCTECANSPPFGACCVTGCGFNVAGCITNIPEVTCNNFGGTFLGSGVSCAGDNDQDGVDDACPGADPTGACCDGAGGCQEETQAQCAGTYFGDGTLCNQFDCRFGACCSGEGRRGGGGGGACFEELGEFCFEVFGGDGSTCAQLSPNGFCSCCSGECFVAFEDQCPNPVQSCAFNDSSPANGVDDACDECAVDADCGASTECLPVTCAVNGGQGGEAVCQSNPLASGSACDSSSNSGCNAPDTCDGDGSCINRFKSAGTTCRSTGGNECDVAEFCTGNSSSCPTNVCEDSGTLCSGGAGECDGDCNCLGTVAACCDQVGVCTEDLAISDCLNVVLGATVDACLGDGDGDGRDDGCPECITNANCDDAEECTVDTCDGVCLNSPKGNTESCDGGANQCKDGVCSGLPGGSDGDSTGTTKTDEAVTVALSSAAGSFTFSTGANRASRAPLYATVGGEPATVEQMIFSSIATVDRGTTSTDPNILIPRRDGTNERLKLSLAVIKDALAADDPDTEVTPLRILKAYMAIAASVTTDSVRNFQLSVSGARGLAAMDQLQFAFDQTFAAWLAADGFVKDSTEARCLGGSNDNASCSSNDDCSLGVCGVPCTTKACLVDKLRLLAEDVGLGDADQSEIPQFGLAMHELRLSAEDLQEEVQKSIDQNTPDLGLLQFYGSHWTSRWPQKRAYLSETAGRASHTLVTIRGNDQAAPAFARQTFQVPTGTRAIQALEYLNDKDKWVLALVWEDPGAARAPGEMLVVFFVDETGDGLPELVAVAAETLPNFTPGIEVYDLQMYQPTDDKMNLLDTRGGNFYQLSLLEGVPAPAAQSSSVAGADRTSAAPVRVLIESAEISQDGGGYTFYLGSFEVDTGARSENALATRYIFTLDADAFSGDQAIAYDIAGDVVVQTTFGTVAQLRKPFNTLSWRFADVPDGQPLTLVQLFGNPDEMISLFSIGRAGETLVAQGLVRPEGSTEELTPLVDIDRNNLYLVRQLSVGGRAVQALQQETAFFVPEYGQTLDSITFDVDQDSVPDRLQLSVDPPRLHWLRGQSARSAAPIAMDYVYETVLLRDPLGTEPELTKPRAFRSCDIDGCTMIGTNEDIELALIPGMDPSTYYQKKALVDLELDGSADDTAVVRRFRGDPFWQLEIITGIGASRSSASYSAPISLPDNIIPSAANILDLDGDGDMDVTVEDLKDILAGGTGPVCYFNQLIIDGNSGGPFDFILGECPIGAEPPMAAPSPHDIPKNRFVSIGPIDGAAVSLMVELLDLACTVTGKKCNSTADCKACVGGNSKGDGCSISSDCPGGSCVLSGETCDEQSAPVMLGWVGDPFEAGGDALPGTFTAEVVKTQPAARTWAEAVVHIGDCEIAPVETYAISSTTNGSVFSDPLVIGTIEQPRDKFWGDVVGSFDGTSWSVPNVLVNVDDIVATLSFLQLKPGAPHVTVIDIVGGAPTYVNFDVNATDLLVVLQAFGGQAYPPPSFVAEGYPADGDVTQCP